MEFHAFKKQPRYKKTRKECAGGCRLSGLPRLHDSIEESRYCDTLRLLVKAGEYDSYESQKTFQLRDPSGKRAGAHRVDFVVKRGDKVMVHEYKGKLFGTLPEYIIKRALFRWCYPEIEYHTVNKNDIVI